MNDVCPDLLASAGAINQNTYATLLRSIVIKKNGLSVQDLDTLLRSSKPLNPVRDLNVNLNASDRHSYEVGFARAITQKFDWSSVQEEIRSLIESETDNQYRGALAKKATESILLPFSVLLPAMTDSAFATHAPDFLQSRNRGAQSPRHLAKKPNMNYSPMFIKTFQDSLGRS